MRILMLGNSLTTTHDLPTVLGSELDALVEVHARGGARLAEHLNPGTRLGSMTQHALEHEQWDYVVLQESSNGPLRFRSRFLEASGRLCEQVRAAGGTPVLFATWAYAPACPKLTKMGISHETMHEQLTNAYHEAGRAGHAHVADVGRAFFEHADKESLYRADGVHPSENGAALAGRVIAHCLRHAEAQDAQVPTAEGQPTYTVYVLRCEDGSFYTGITTDIERRLAEHMSRGPKAARYTRTHPVAALEATWGAPDRATASALEYRIKRLTHSEKKALVEHPDRIEGLSIGSKGDLSSTAP